MNRVVAWYSRHSGIVNRPKPRVALSYNIYRAYLSPVEVRSSYRYDCRGVDTGLVLSDPYAHKCCKIAGIKSKSKHYRNKKAGDPGRVYPNLLLSELQIDGPLQCVVSDMTAFYVKGVYHELTLYMDLWNNEIVSHALSAKRGDRMTYISGLESLLDLKKLLPDHEMILHSDQGSVYSSKSFNKLLKGDVFDVLIHTLLNNIHFT